MTKELSERTANNEIVRKNLEQFSLFPICKIKLDRKSHLC